MEGSWPESQPVEAEGTLIVCQKYKVLWIEAIRFYNYITILFYFLRLYYLITCIRKGTPSWSILEICLFILISWEYGNGFSSFCKEKKRAMAMGRRTLKLLPWGWRVISKACVLIISPGPWGSIYWFWKSSVRGQLCACHSLPLGACLNFCFLFVFKVIYFVFQASYRSLIKSKLLI